METSTATIPITQADARRITAALQFRAPVDRAGGASTAQHCLCTLLEQVCTDPILVRIDATASEARSVESIVAYATDKVVALVSEIRGRKVVYDVLAIGNRGIVGNPAYRLPKSNGTAGDTQS